MVKTEQRIQSELKSESKSKSRSMVSSPPSSSSSNKKKYKGVRMRSWGSWVSEIRTPNQKTRIWLGSYSTPEAAARAYDAALICLKGTSANLNFPNNTNNININTNMSPKSIQRVAAAAAANITTTNGIIITNNDNHNHPSSAATSSSSVISSTSSVVSDQHQEDDIVSLMQSLDGFNQQMAPLMDQPLWYNDDQLLMFNGGLLDHSFDPVMDDFYEDGDIRLWSFC